MTKINSTHNWWVDVLVFSGFILTFFMDFTGVSLHQWLGVAVCALAVYHLLVHWPWVKAVARRFTVKKQSQTREFFFIDLILAVGFLTMLVTGLVISTWFNLTLNNFSTWKNIHVYASIGSLSILLIKIGLHWRWIVSTTRKVFARPVNGRSFSNAQTTLMANKMMDRRDFIRLMGPVTLITAVAVTGAVKAIRESAENALSNQYVQAAAATQSPTQGATTQVATTQSNVIDWQATGTSTPGQLALQPTSTPQAVVACSYRCPRGNHCSYPGRCHNYRDSNGNGLCDLGECL